LVSHSGWGALSPEDALEVRTIYASKSALCWERHDRAITFLQEISDLQAVKNLKKSETQRLREIFRLCGGEGAPTVLEIFSRLKKKLLADVSIMLRNAENVAELATKNISPGDMIPKMLEETLLAGLQRLDSDNDRPSTIQEIMESEHYTPEKRSIAEVVLKSRWDDHYCLKILCRGIPPHWINAQFQPYLEATPPQRPGDSNNWFFVRYFAILKAYVFDLVENPPSPDHGYLRVVERNTQVLTSNIQKITNEITLLVASKTKVQTMLQKAIEPLKPKFQEKLAEWEEKIGAVSAQIMSIHQEKDRFERLVSLLGRVKKEEESALLQLELFEKNLINRGNFSKVKVEKAAAEQALVKYAVGREQERRVVEATAKRGLSESLPPPSEKGPELSPSFAQKELPVSSAAASLSHNAAAEEVTSPEEDGLDPKIEGEVKEDVRKIYAYRQRHPRTEGAAAALPEEEGGGKIYLSKKDVEIVTEFWEEDSLSWNKFTKFFTRILGASLQPNVGSIRNFKFPNGKLIVVHEGHPDPTLGPRTLKRLREFVQEHLGLSKNSFLCKT
jgi:hypothetical protein